MLLDELWRQWSDGALSTYLEHHPPVYTITTGLEKLFPGKPFVIQEIFIIENIAHCLVKGKNYDKGKWKQRLARALGVKTILNYDSESQSAINRYLELCAGYECLL